MAVEALTTFSSWKEIANYLGKGVRTVQRWEARLGLPVQRPNQRDKGIVRASREDLDNWVAARWATRAKDAKSLTEQLTMFRERVTELTDENAKLRSQLEVMRSNRMGAFRASEASGVSDMFLRISNDVGALRHQIAEMRDFTGNIRALNHLIKTSRS